MKRSTNRYLTTHVGSMIRPPKITEYVEALIAGQTIDEPAFEQELRARVGEVVHQQVEAGVDMVSRENVVPSTDCGFAQTSRIARQHPSIVWAKLEALAEGARIAWNEDVRV